MCIADGDTHGLAHIFPVSAINSAAAVLEGSLGRRLFPIE